MLYRYIYLKGEKQLRLWCKKTNNDFPRFCESFAHIGSITIERIYEMPNNDEGYREYFMIYQQHEKGTMHPSDIRSKVKEDIRNNERNITRL